MSFYDEVLREILAALGAALFFSRVLVLVRRGRHHQLVDVPAGPVRGGLADDGDADDGDDEVDPTFDPAFDPALGGEPLAGDDDAVDDEVDPAEEDDEVLDEEPIARTLVFLVLGFVVMVAGLAAVIAG